MPIGQRLRQLRTERGVKGRQLAVAAAVSPSLISQIENNATTPSIDVLRRIAAALHVKVGDFFDEDSDPPAVNGAPPTATKRPLVVRANQRKKLMLPASKWVYQLLTPDLRGRLELLWLEIGPGLPAPVEASVHEGEEAGVVIKGRVHIWVEDEEYVLEEGDTITFEATRPHRTANVDDEPAIIVTASTPPSF